MKSMKSNTPMSERDTWRTPLPVFDWLNDRFRFGIDLAAFAENALCAEYIDIEYDALSTSWVDYSKQRGVAPVGFCNPPYSNISPWVEAAGREMLKGFTTVMLIPSPNGEEYHQKALDYADELILIHGRLAFINAQGKPVAGNTRGSCVYVFTQQGFGVSETRLRHIERDLIFSRYGGVE